MICFILFVVFGRKEIVLRESYVFFFMDIVFIKGEEELILLGILEIERERGEIFKSSC